MIAPKYRTDARACSCPGFWYRRTCKHYRAYREAVALVQAQDVFNQAWSPIPARLASIGGASQTPILGNLPGMVKTIPANIAGMGKGTPARVRS